MPKARPKAGQAELAKPRKPTVHSVAVDVAQYDPDTLFLRVAGAEGTIENTRFEISTSVNGTGLIVRIGKRWFALNGADLVQAIYRDFFDQKNQFSKKGRAS